MKEMTGEENLCMAGGVAFNSVMNGRIFHETPFKNYGHAAVFGRHLSDKLPSLRHFESSTTSLLPKLLSPLLKGNRYGRITGTVGRIFGQR